MRGEGSPSKVLNCSRFFSKKITGAEETFKEFQEGMALTSRIMKEGLRHSTALKGKETSWTRVAIV